MTEKLTPKQGRQGNRGRPALFVLISSVGLMVVALFGLMIWNGAEAPASYAAQSQAASRKLITGSTSGQSDRASSANSGDVPAGNPAYPQPAVRNAND